MTDRTVKAMIFKHKPELRFKEVGKAAPDERILADDDVVGVIILNHYGIDTWRVLPAWDPREPAPPWAKEVLGAARVLLQGTNRVNHTGADAIVCFAQLQ